MRARSRRPSAAYTPSAAAFTCAYCQALIRFGRNDTHSGRSPNTRMAAVTGTTWLAVNTNHESDAGPTSSARR